MMVLFDPSSVASPLNLPTTRMTAGLVPADSVCSWANDVASTGVAAPPPVTALVPDPATEPHPTSFSQGAGLTAPPELLLHVTPIEGMVTLASARTPASIILPASALGGALASFTPPSA